MKCGVSIIFNIVSGMRTFQLMASIAKTMGTRGNQDYVAFLILNSQLLIYNLAFTCQNMSSQIIQYYNCSLVCDSSDGVE